MGTEDQGWVAHFLIRALKGEAISHLRRRLPGAGRARRVGRRRGLHGRLAAHRPVQGRAFNLGGGPANAVSLRQVIRFIEGQIGRPVETRLSDWRAGDQRYYVSDTRLAAQALGLKPATPWKTGVAALTRWLMDERGIKLPTQAGEARTAEALP
jgi:CDP-paratose 2-epimerase